MSRAERKRDSAEWEWRIGKNQEKRRNGDGGAGRKRKSQERRESGKQDTLAGINDGNAKKENKPGERGTKRAWQKENRKGCPRK